MSDRTRPSEVAALAMKCVQQGERDAWLGLFDADVLYEDPVGYAPARRGAAELAEFWDTAIAGMEDVRIEPRSFYEAPDEVIAFAQVSVRAPGGGSASYEAAIHYVIDDGGKIVSLRAFWDLANVVGQLSADAD